VPAGGSQSFRDTSPEVGHPSLGDRRAVGVVGDLLVPDGPREVEVVGHNRGLEGVDEYLFLGKLPITLVNRVERSSHARKLRDKRHMVK